MNELIYIAGFFLAGSLLWFALQTGTWMMFVRNKHGFEVSKQLLCVGLAVGPAFVFLVNLILAVFRQDFSFSGLVWMPLMAFWVFLVSLAGLYTAARWRKIVLKEKS